MSVLKTTTTSVRAHGNHPFALISKMATTTARASCLSMTGLTLLQITKHCQESMPDIASGVVLGMERDGVLEVTHSFPTPDNGKASGARGDANAHGAFWRD